MFLGLHCMQNLDAEVNPLISELEESNALALAIIAPGIYNSTSTIVDTLNTKLSRWALQILRDAMRGKSHQLLWLHAGDQNKTPASQYRFDCNSSGWELALVTAPSTHTSQAVETNFVCAILAPQPDFQISTFLGEIHKKKLLIKFMSHDCKLRITHI